MSYLKIRSDTLAQSYIDLFEDSRFMIKEHIRDRIISLDKEDMGGMEDMVGMVGMEGMEDIEDSF